MPKHTSPLASGHFFWYVNKPIVFFPLHTLAPIPPHTIIKLDASPTKTIQRTPYREIYFTPAQSLDRFQVLQVPTAAGICHRDGTPLCQTLNQSLVYAPL